LVNKMITRLVSINTAVCRLSLSACLVMAVVFGAILDTGISAQADLADLHNNSDSQKYQADTPDPVGSNSMTGTEPVGKSHDVYITTPALVSGGGFEYRRPVLKAVCYTTLCKSDYSRFSDLTTTASISSKKAHEFTLVGAKPSGTG
jgi:hypothetical protein